MALPGFTAEDSVGPTVQSYRITATYKIGAQFLSPQQADFEDQEMLNEADMGENDIDDDELNDSLTGDEV